MPAIDAARQEDDLRQKIMRERIKSFVETYTPEDREKAFYFDADLIALIHNMNIDIADRYGKHMAAMAALNPLMPKT